MPPVPHKRQHEAMLRFVLASEPVLRSWFTVNASRPDCIILPPIN